MELHGEPASDEHVAAEIAPCFVERDGRRTDTVVLACTHYPLIAHRFEKLAPWPVRTIDPAPAIARRVADLLGPPVPGAKPLPAQAVFTSGRKPPAALGAFGLTEKAPAGV
jgi:glutamate racemase